MKKETLKSVKLLNFKHLIIKIYNSLIKNYMTLEELIPEEDREKYREAVDAYFSGKPTNHIGGKDPKGRSIIAQQNYSDTGCYCSVVFSVTGMEEISQLFTIESKPCSDEHGHSVYIITLNNRHLWFEKFLTMSPEQRKNIFDMLAYIAIVGSSVLKEKKDDSFENPQNIIKKFFADSKWGNISKYTKN